MNDVLNMFCKAGNREIGAVICDDFGFVFTGDFNGAKLTLDFWVVFDVVLNFDFVMDLNAAARMKFVYFL